MSDKKSANLKVEDGRRMRDEEIFEYGCARMRAKNSAKEGEVWMVRRVRATLVKMVVHGGSLISHKLLRTELEVDGGPKR